MEPVRRTNRCGYIYGVRTACAIAALALALILSSASNSYTAAKNRAELTFDDQRAAERASRSSYRKLEIASLVIIFIVGTGAVCWVMLRRKP